MNIDTNILIAFITGNETVVSFVNSCRIQGLYLYISTVTVTELKLPDAIIAATALHTGTPLLTRNVKDFKKVRGLKLLEV